MKKIALIFALLLSAFTVFSDDQLSLSLDTYRILSHGNKFYLECDSKKNTTTCFEVTEKGDKEKWTIHDCQKFAYVSDNGVFCILDHTLGLVETNYNEDTVLFKVYKNGKLFDTLTVGKVYKKPIYVSIHIIASHYSWGDIQNLYDDGILFVTYEGEQQFWYDFSNKKILSAQKKLTEIAEKRREDAFKALDKTFSDFMNNIENNDDKEKLSAAVAKFQSLYRNKKQTDSPIYYYDVFEDGDVQLKLRYSDGYAFKGAFGHYVKALFTFHDGNTHINFFLCDDDCDLFIDIAGGGKRENVIGFGSADSDSQPEQDPARYYEFNAKTKEVHICDYYWE